MAHTLRLVKTTGGNSGTPLVCGKCGSQHFAKSGIAWHCTTCGIYHPTQLGFDSLKESIRKLHELHEESKFIRQELEDLVRE